MTRVVWRQRIVGVRALDDATSAESAELPNVEQKSEELEEHLVQEQNAESEWVTHDTPENESANKTTHVVDEDSVSERAVWVQYSSTVPEVSASLSRREWRGADCR